MYLFTEHLLLKRPTCQFRHPITERFEEFLTVVIGKKMANDAIGYAQHGDLPRHETTIETPATKGVKACHCL